MKTWVNLNKVEGALVDSMVLSVINQLYSFLNTLPLMDVTVMKQDWVKSTKNVKA